MIIKGRENLFMSSSFWTTDNEGYQVKHVIVPEGCEGDSYSVRIEPVDAEWEHGEHGDRYFYYKNPDKKPKKRLLIKDPPGVLFYVNKETGDQWAIMKENGARYKLAHEDPNWQHKYDGLYYEKHPDEPLTEYGRRYGFAKTE